MYGRTPETYGQDMVIAGKLVLMGPKMPPTHKLQVLVCRLFFTNCGFSGDGAVSIRALGMGTFTEKTREY